MKFWQKPLETPASESALTEDKFDPEREKEILNCFVCEITHQRLIEEKPDRQRLTNLVGESKAMELILIGDMIKAYE